MSEMDTRNDPRATGRTNNFHIFFMKDITGPAVEIYAQKRATAEPHWSNTQRERPELFEAIETAIRACEEPFDKLLQAAISRHPPGSGLIPLKEAQAESQRRREALETAYEGLFDELIRRGVPKPVLWG